MVNDAQIARPLGHFERLMEAVYYTDQYCGTALSCRYMLPDDLTDVSSHSKVQRRFTRAIAQTIQQHPLLQVGLMGEATKSPMFVKLDHIKLDDIMQWRSVSPTEDYGAVVGKTLEKELETKFVNVATQPGYRMVILRPENSVFLDVLFIFKHTMFDGTSSKIFHRTLLDCLNDPFGDVSQLRLNDDLVLSLEPGKLNYPPPPESMARYTLTFDFIISMIWMQLKSKIWPAVPTATQSTLEATKSHSFISVTAMNMRRFMPSRPVSAPDIEMNPERLISNIVSVTEHHFDEQTVEELKKLIKPHLEGQGIVHLEEVVWAVARSTREDLENKLEMGLKNDPMNLLQFVSDWRIERQKAESRPRRETWQVTNLGVLDGTASISDKVEANNWRINHAAFSLSAEAARALFSCAAVTAKNGGLCIELTWQSGMGKHIDIIGTQLYKDMQEWLNYAATGEWAKINGGLVHMFSMK